MHTKSKYQGLLFILFLVGGCALSENAEESSNLLNILDPISREFLQPSNLSGVLAYRLFEGFDQQGEFVRTQGLFPLKGQSLVFNSYIPSSQGILEIFLVSLLSELGDTGSIHNIIPFTQTANVAVDFLGVLRSSTFPSLRSGEVAVEVSSWGLIKKKGGGASISNSLSGYFLAHPTLATNFETFNIENTVTEISHNDLAGGFFLQEYKVLNPGETISYKITYFFNSFSNEYTLEYVQPHLVYTFDKFRTSSPEQFAKDNDNHINFIDGREYNFKVFPDGSGSTEIQIQDLQGWNSTDLIDIRPYRSGNVLKLTQTQEDINLIEFPNFEEISNSSTGGTLVVQFGFKGASPRSATPILLWGLNLTEGLSFQFGGIEDGTSSIRLSGTQIDVSSVFQNSNGSDDAVWLTVVIVADGGTGTGSLEVYSYNPNQSSDKVMQRMDVKELPFQNSNAIYRSWINGNLVVPSNRDVDNIFYLSDIAYTAGVPMKNLSTGEGTTLLRRLLIAPYYYFVGLH